MMNGPRVLILWAHLPGYLAACLRALLDTYRASVLIIVNRPDPQSHDKILEKVPGFRFIDMSSSDAPNERNIRRMIHDYRPQMTVAGVGKWGPLPRLAAAAKDAGSLVIWAIDHIWCGSWRDHVNAVLANLGVIYNRFDGVWVTGSLGRQYAKRLGFPTRCIFEGVLACDTDLFRTVGERRFATDYASDWPRVFLYVGRYIECKDLNTLVRAYAQYRKLADLPWELWCAGNGPLASVLRAQDGIRNLGYQTSEGCATLMGKSGAFILPSRFEPWGVVLHEAACAGLPILASDACGGTANLVRDGYNGFCFPAQDDKRLASLMHYVARRSCAGAMGRNSLSMSRQFDPELWAETLLLRIPNWLDRGISNGHASMARSSLCCRPGSDGTL
jgi:glycosyltransferase involved in cell wall biosynthesis